MSMMDQSIDMGMEEELPKVTKRHQEKALTSEQFEHEIKQNKTKLSQNERIKFLVVRVCEDSPKTFLLSIEKLAESIIEYTTHAEKMEYKSVLLRYLVDSISLLSFKQAVYATVLALVLRKSKIIFNEIFKRITDQLQASLDAGERVKARNLLILISELMIIGVINCYSYKDLIMSILEECKAGSELTTRPSHLREYYLSIVIPSLAHSAVHLKTKIGNEFEPIEQAVTELMNARDTSYLSLFKSKFEASRDLDSMQMLWTSIQRETIAPESNGQSKAKPTLDSIQITNPYSLFESELNKIEQPDITFNLDFKNRVEEKCIFSASLFTSNILKSEEEIEEINARDENEQDDEGEDEDDELIDDDEEQDQRRKKEKKPKKASSNSQQPKVAKLGFSLFPVTTQRLLVLENIELTVDLFGESKKNLFQQFQTITRVMGSTKEQVNFVYAALVDSLISRTLRPRVFNLQDQACLLNSSLTNSLYTANREQSDSLLVAIYQQISNRISELPMDSVEQLAEFLSHVISENHLQFAWEQTGVSRITAEHVVSSVDQKVLLWKDVIHRLCSLCGRDRVIAALSKKSDENAPLNANNQALLLFVTPISAKEVIVVSYQDSEDGIARRFLEKLVQKKTSEEMGKDIQAVIQENCSLEEDTDEAKLQVASNVLCVFLECLFYRSCETFTHLKILYDRYSGLLKSLHAEYQESFSAAVIDMLLSFWQNNYFSLEIYLKKFIMNKIITPEAIVESIFTHIESIDMTQSSSQRRVHQLWLFLRRITHNIVETCRNYAIESAALKNANKDDLLEAVAFKHMQAKDQQTDLLSLLFTRFQTIFSSQQLDEETLESKQYIIYFFYFFRRYKSLVEWDLHYNRHFTAFPYLSKTILSSY